MIKYKESELKPHQEYALKFFKLRDFLYSRSQLNKTEEIVYELGKEIYENLEPELKPVGMEVLANSGIDCEFWDWHHRKYTCFLESLNKKYNGETLFLSSKGFEPKCKPRMNYWFSSLNFDSAQTLVSILRDHGFKVETDTSRSMHGERVLAFRITGLQEGYCWPWELNNEQ